MYNENLTVEELVSVREKLKELPKNRCFHPAIERTKKGNPEGEKLYKYRAVVKLNVLNRGALTPEALEQREKIIGDVMVDLREKPFQPFAEGCAKEGRLNPTYSYTGGEKYDYSRWIPISSPDDRTYFLGASTSDALNDVAFAFRENLWGALNYFAYDAEGVKDEDFFVEIGVKRVMKTRPVVYKGTPNEYTLQTPDGCFSGKGYKKPKLIEPEPDPETPLIEVIKPDEGSSSSSSSDVVVVVVVQ